jgi:tetratricopeptide (TPR) repeat protein
MNREHPEDLLDLAVTDNLTAVDRVGLAQHLVVCSECALYMETADLFRAERVGKYQDRAQGRVQGMTDDGVSNRWTVERAMARLEPRGRGRGRGWFPWGWRPVRTIRLGAAGLLLMAAAVSAKLWTGKLKEAELGLQPDQSASAQARGRSRRSGNATLAVEAPEPEDTMPQEDEGGGDRSRAGRAGLAPRRSPQDTAAGLFERARELGRQRKLDAAIGAHLRLQRLYPETPEAVLSSALAGQLLLARGRPAAALAQFDRHLARGGGAQEEALAGRANALGRLGRTAEEIRAWRALLERHPGSVYGDRANARLRELSARD